MQGPVEQLLHLTRDILETERKLARERLIDLGGRLAIVFGPIALLALSVITIVTFRRLDLGKINCAASPILLVGVAGAVAYLAYVVWLPFEGQGGREKSPAELRLDLTLLHEQRRLRAAELALEPRYARSAYKEQVASDLQQFRKEAKYYRRVHNWLQSVIILGSLATTTVSGIAVEGANRLRWLAVATSFAVGVAAGFTGYFKFRERSFYLQQTADAIEQEWTAADLSIYHYRDLSRDQQLTALVEEIERLKSEQRKREQSLEQPSDNRRDSVAG